MRTIFVLLLISFISCSENEGTPDSAEQAFEKVLKKSLESDELQPFVVALSDTYNLPIYVAYSEGMYTPYPKVEVNGKPVVFIRKSEADSLGITCYFWVTEYVFIDSSARIMLANHETNLHYGSSFDLIDDEWIVLSTYFDTL